MNKEKAQQIVDLISEIARYQAFSVHFAITGNVDTSMQYKNTVVKNQQQLVTLLTEEK